MINQIVKGIESHTWTFAKTMPQAPHWYTLRKDWVDQEFIDFVLFIRQFGHPVQFGNRKYIKFNINGFEYWTMGAAINTPEGAPYTIIINRAKINYGGNYDKIALDYDKRYENPEHEAEDRQAFGMVRAEGRILDVGCGTGLMLKYLSLKNVKSYTGIDPSQGMLNILDEKHYDPKVKSTNTPVNDFYDHEKFDGIYSMFGSASYLTVPELIKLMTMLEPGGKMYLMFLRYGYQTPYHKEINDNIRIALNDTFGEAWKHYIIVTEKEIDDLIRRRS